MTESTRRPSVCPFAIFLARPITARAFLVLAFVAVFGLGCRARNSNDAAVGLPDAAFAASATHGAPGLTVAFTDQSSGNFDTLLWDFGNGSTSTVANPNTSYPTAGTYSVSLTVTGTGGSDTTTMTIQVADAPTAGFTCAPEIGFAPVSTVCFSTATSAATISWRLERVGTGDVSLLTGASPVIDLTAPDTYTLTQTVYNGIGQTDMTSTSLRALPLSASSSVPSGSPPGDVVFTAHTGGVPATLQGWLVDNVMVGTESTLSIALRTPGTYSIEYQFGSLSPPIAGSIAFDHVVGYGAPAAAFSRDVQEGPGPLTVAFADESLGSINSWSWDFGDGNTCVYPASVAGPGDDVCTSPSPTHTYAAIGRYDVQLSVTGDDIDPNDPELVDATTLANAVTVTIVDPSFEEQGVGVQLGGSWTAITPATVTAVADHIALSTTVAPAGDAGMPTDGQKWAALDGLGTDGTEAAVVVENGVRQDFLRPAVASVLEFDYVLLYAEPPAGAVLDAMTATVSDGATTVEITSARADVSSPYAGHSTQYPTLDGSTTRVTPVRTASIDLAAAFPGAAADTVYTLTIRLTNDANDFRSPRAYADHVRFAEPVAPFTAQFSAPATIVAGQPADFLDETCPDPIGLGCEVPTSWRWDFDTQFATTPPPASGSGLQDPSYTFAEPGIYDVRLLARNADQESLAQLTVSVLAAPIAIPAVQSASGSSAPATITFGDQSTSDPSDPIVSWSWDFAGWGTSTAQNPAPVAINQSGTWTIRLTITTVSGQTDTQSIDVVLD